MSNFCFAHLITQSIFLIFAILTTVLCSVSLLAPPPGKKMDIGYSWALSFAYPPETVV